LKEGLFACLAYFAVKKFGASALSLHVSFLSLLSLTDQQCGSALRAHAGARSTFMESRQTSLNHREP
jgi:hypothetical protein